ncbi:MAG: carbohydrate ABC transporter permease [Alkalispirochaetaceae bacterium]
MPTALGSAKRKRFFDKRDNRGYLFVLPYFLVFLALQLYPMIYTFILSLQTPINMFENEFAGFENYKRLLTTPLFYQAIGNTWYIWLVNFIPQIAFALFLGVVLSEGRVRGGETLRTLYFLPNLVTAASVGVLFAVLMDWRFGTLNHVLTRLGLLEEPINWLWTPLIAQGTVSFIQWWQWFGYTTIIVMAGLTGINEDLYEAAFIDGANRWQLFRSVTLPLLRPTMLYITITSLIGGLQIFDIPRVLTNGRGAPDNALTTMVLYLYNQAFSYFNIGYGSAVAYALFVMILVFSIIAFKVINFERKPAGRIPGRRGL